MGKWRTLSAKARQLPRGRVALLPRLVPAGERAAIVFPLRTTANDSPRCCTRLRISERLRLRSVELIGSAMKASIDQIL